MATLLDALPMTSYDVVPPTTKQQASRASRYVAESAERCVSERTNSENPSCELRATGTVCGRLWYTAAYFIQLLVRVIGRV